MGVRLPKKMPLASTEIRSRMPTGELGSSQTAIAYATMPKNRYMNMQKHATRSQDICTLAMAAQNCPICPVTTR